MELKRPKITPKEYCINCGMVVTSAGVDSEWYHLPEKPYQDNNYRRECEPAISHGDPKWEQTYATPPVSAIQTEEHLKDLDDIDALLG